MKAWRKYEYYATEPAGDNKCNASRSNQKENPHSASNPSIITGLLHIGQDYVVPLWHSDLQDIMSMSELAWQNEKKVICECHKCMSLYTADLHNTVFFFKL